MRKVEIIPATLDLITEFEGQPPELTQKTLAVRENNETIALTGILLNQSRWILFSHIHPDVQKDLRKYKREVILASRKVLEMVKNQPLPVYAKAQEGVDGSDRLLIHLGFVHIERGLYKWQPQHPIS